MTRLLLLLTITSGRVVGMRSSMENKLFSGSIEIYSLEKNILVEIDQGIDKTIEVYTQNFQMYLDIKKADQSRISATEFNQPVNLSTVKVYINTQTLTETVKIVKNNNDFRLLMKNEKNQIDNKKTKELFDLINQDKWMAFLPYSNHSQSKSFYYALQEHNLLQKIIYNLSITPYLVKRSNQEKINKTAANVDKIIQESLDKNNQWFFGIKKYDKIKFKAHYYDSSNSQKVLIIDYKKKEEALANVYYFRVKKGSATMKMTTSYRFITYAGNVATLCIIGYGMYQVYKRL